MLLGTGVTLVFLAWWCGTCLAANLLGGVLYGAALAMCQRQECLLAFAYNAMWLYAALTIVCLAARAQNLSAHVAIA